MTQVLPVHDLARSGEAIARAAELLRAGELVAFPTETVYGLGANALDERAAAKIFAAKGRPANNPLIVHVLGADEARDLAMEWPEIADRLAATFWPGPLTLVLRKRPLIPDSVTAGSPTVALRAPSHPVARALLAAAKIPIAAPSANRSNEISATTAAHVLKGLASRIALILDGGPTSGGLESTVLDLTSERPRLLRPGLISPAQIEAVIGPISKNLPAAANDNSALPSPGSLPRHYAPRATMELLAPQRAEERVQTLAATGSCVGWLTFSQSDILSVKQIVAIAMPSEPTLYATRLYAALHELDDAGVGRIIVELPPDDAAWLAIHDRLKRGATKQTLL